MAEQSVQPHDSEGLRMYWSEVANPETLLEGPTRKLAEGKFRQVLREIAGIETAIALPFPAVVDSVEAIDAVWAEARNRYAEALHRLADMVQYELTATWAEEQGVDLATPMKGAEYMMRRQQREVRVSAIDNKLRTVTAGIVRDWRMRQERRNHVWVALLPYSERDRFIAGLRSAGPSEGVRLRLSGPWPPNDFI